MTLTPDEAKLVERLQGFVDACSGHDITLYEGHPAVLVGEAIAAIIRIAEERGEAFRANERDRSIIADARSAFSAALERRSWLLHGGRGSYEWDDDRWKDEFGAAIDELRAPLDVLGKIGIDWSLCPTSPDEIAAARIDWQARASAAESLAAQALRERDEAREALKPFAREADARANLALGPDIDDWPIGGSALTLGDLRAARRALSEQPDKERML